MKLFLNDQQITKSQGFGSFNIAAKWKRTYRGFKTKEPWYILTNFSELEVPIAAYQKRFGIEEMFRDFKVGGKTSSLEQHSPQRLTPLALYPHPLHTKGILAQMVLLNPLVQLWHT